MDHAAHYTYYSASNDKVRQTIFAVFIIFYALTIHLGLLGCVLGHNAF